MDKQLEKSLSDYEHSFELFKSLLTTDFPLDSYPPARAKDKTFGIEFPGGLIRKPHYTSCSFINAVFDASNGALSKFHDCEFINSTLNNCDFRYCDILRSTFTSEKGQMRILSCNFSYGNFIESMFSDTEFYGCSFRQMQFEGTEFSRCVMEHSSIEQSVIRNCSFSDIDMRKVGVRYCDFENVEFKSVVFHILDLARNYGLIPLLQKSPQEVIVAYKNDQVMPLSEALVQLRGLLPYYFETRQFYQMLNIYAAYHETDSIMELLPYAFKCVISDHDFADLQDLCSLIVKFNIFSGKQLRDFYGMIKQLVEPNNFPHYLQKSYNTYIENIKRILVDNPNNNPEAHILLKTDIVSLDDLAMHKLLNAVEANIDNLAPDAIFSIQLTKHSPYEILIVICEELPLILQVCQSFYYALGGLKSLSDIAKSMRERTDNHAKKNQAQKPNSAIHKKKHIELSLGRKVVFKFEEEYTEHVISMEYTVH